VKISTSLGRETQGDGKPAACRLVEIQRECK
jgi:hypothetical protein